MALVVVDLDSEHAMPLPARLFNLPEHGRRLVSRWSDKNYGALRLAYPDPAVSLPRGIKRILYRIVYELDVVPLISRVSGSKSRVPTYLPFGMR